MGAAASLFSNTDSSKESLERRISPTKDDRDYLQENWNRLGEFLLCELQKKWDGGVSSWIQGSYKFGTLLRPLHPRDEYDVDLGLYIECIAVDENNLPSARQLKQWVHEFLLEYEAYDSDAIEVPDEKERCSRIRFRRNFHIDTPSYKLLTDQDQRRLATKSYGWEDSDPKAIYVWFRDCLPQDRRVKMRRIVRYVKAWSKISFSSSSGSQPTSIMLSVLVAQAMQADDSINAAPEDEALTILLRHIVGRLEKDTQVMNPVNSTENLNRMSSVEYEGFERKLCDFLAIAESAVLKSTSLMAAVQWSKSFAHLFPLPDDSEIVTEEYSISIPAPEIRIHATDRRSGRSLGTFENVVPEIQANANLTFTITNPQFIPNGALITWTVRNSQAHAEEKNDLGHTTTSSGITATEHTAYKGTHHMDCVVERNGQVISMRRIPVTVKTDWLKRPRRNPTRPSWTKLRKRRRR